MEHAQGLLSIAVRVHWMILASRKVQEYKRVTATIDPKQGTDLNDISQRSICRDGWVHRTCSQAGISSHRERVAVMVP